MKSVDKLTVDELQIEKNKLDIELKHLREKVGHLHNKITWRCNRLGKIHERLDENLLHKDDIESLLEAEPETKHKRKLLQEFLEPYHLRADSYFPSTMQRCVKIALYKDNDEITKKTYEGIMKLLPYVKPIKGFKEFDIFEHTLSAYHSYWLLYDVEKEVWSVNISRSYSHKDIYLNDDLMDVLKYIQQNHYYED